MMDQPVLMIPLKRTSLVIFYRLRLGGGGELSLMLSSWQPSILCALS